MLTSTCPRLEFRPMMTRFCRMRYSKSRPSSLAIAVGAGSWAHCTFEGDGGADLSESSAHASLSELGVNWVWAMAGTRGPISPTLSTRGARTPCTRAHHKTTARTAAVASRPGYPEPAEPVPLQFEVTDGTHMRKVSTCAVNKNYINHHTTTW